MRRAAIVLPCAIAVATVLGLAVAGATSEDRYTASAAVPRTRQPSLLAPGARYCGRAAVFPFRLDAIRVALVTGGAAGPPLRVTASSPARRVVASGVVQPGYRASGYPSPASVLVTLGPLAPGTKTTICVTNAGWRAVALYAGRAASGRRDPGLTAVELRRRRRSVLGGVPDIVHRAALFHPPWLGVATIWLLFAALVVALPALLSIAVAAAISASASPSSSACPRSRRRP